ncbi:UNVERIFIED_ORG: hypothetical protein J2W85_002530 [Ensifer adhaerens]|nr:hypothetical protein [Ensifer adhaerens]
MIERRSSPPLIPVPVTGIQQRHVRAAIDPLTNTRPDTASKAETLFTGLPMQDGWIPVTSTGMRASRNTGTWECLIR